MLPLNELQGVSQWQVSARSSKTTAMSTLSSEEEEDSSDDRRAPSKENFKKGSEGRNKLCSKRQNNQSESICAKKIESKQLNAKASTLYIIVEAPEPDARRAKLAKRYKNARKAPKKREEQCLVCTQVGKDLTFKAQETETC
jgi:hypothetical protein